MTVEFAAATESWRAYFAFTGLVAAVLVVALSVAASIQIETLMQGPGTVAKTLAVDALASLGLVVLIGVLLLIPDPGHLELGIPLLLLSLFGLEAAGAWMIAQLTSAGQRTSLSALWIWQLAFTVAILLALMVAAILLMVGKTSGLDVLAAVSPLLLISAAGSGFQLMIRLGRSKSPAG